MVSLKRFNLLLLFLLMTNMVYSLPTVTILPYEKAGSIKEERCEIWEDFFITELGKSQWLEICDNRAEEDITRERKLQENLTYHSPLLKYRLPTVDFLAQLLISENRDSYTVYVTAWAAQNGSALFSMKRELKNLPQKNLADLASEVSYRLSEIASPLAYRSTDALLTIGRLDQAESLIHTRFLNEGSSTAIIEDLELLISFQKEKVIDDLSRALVEGESENALLLLNDLIRLDSTYPGIPEFKAQLTLSLEDHYREKGEVLYKESQSNLRMNNLVDAKRNIDRLAFESILSRDSENLPLLVASSQNLQSRIYEDRAEENLQKFKQAQDLREKSRLLTASKDAAIFALYIDPSQSNGTKELGSIESLELSLIDEERRYLLSNSVLSQIYHPSPFLFSIGGSLTQLSEPRASTEISDSSQFGIEISVIRSFAVKDAWSLSLTPGMQFQYGTGHGEGGISEWKKEQYGLWITGETGVEYSLKEIRAGIGPHLRAGLNYDREIWNSTVEDEIWNIIFGYGIYGHITKYLGERSGIDLEGRIFALTQPDRQSSLQSEIVLRLIFDFLQ